MSAGLEVADVLRRHGDAYRRARDDHLERVERRVMSAIELCRTSAPPSRGFVQSGFNEVAQRRRLPRGAATSQNPPDSHSGPDLIQG